MDTQHSEQASKICPGNDPVALRGINELNRQFWLQQSKLRDKRISNETIYKIATDDMNFETLRGVPIKLRKSLEKALADAENAMRLVQSAFSRKGGRTRKRDALQCMIITIVRANRNITQQQLEDKLKEEEGEGIISSIDGEADVLAGDIKKIYFVDSDEREKTASLDGLKDRLSRAKKYIRAKRLMRNL